MDFVVYVLSNYWDIIVSASVLIVQIYLVQSWAYKRNRKLKSNLKNPILLFEIEKGNLVVTEQILQDFDFKKCIRTDDIEISSVIKKESIIVIGYAKTEKTTERIKAIIDIASAKKIPVVVYSTKIRIEDVDMKIISSYAFYELCNSALRLTMTLTNICQHFDYDKPNYKTII